MLVLRDVLGFRPGEVAEMLGSTLDSVNSALKRARAGVPGRDPLAAGREAPPASGSAAEKIIVTRFMRAWESADLDALVSLLTDDVFMSMPPMPFEYEGRLAVARFCSSIFSSGRHFSLVATRAKGQPALGAYVRDPDGIGHAVGLFVLTLSGERICALTRFEDRVVPRFGLARSLPAH